ncbi:MAG: helicase-related protein, partial [Halothece sp.]
YSNAPYHAGLSPEERREIETNWINGKTQFVVCTCAFGMGINKPNVRWVIHFQSPQLLSEYIQEVGRGGRDGKPADALTLISEPTGWLNPEDQQRQQFFVNNLKKQYQQAQKLAQKIPNQGNVSTIAQQYRNGEIALSLLHSAGQLNWLDPFHYSRLSSNAVSSLSQLNRTQMQQQREMKQYLTTKGCRWQFLLNAFGFTQDGQGFRCGHCDNCLRR